MGDSAWEFSLGNVHCARDGARHFSYIRTADEPILPSPTSGSFLFTVFLRSFRAHRILYIDFGAFFGRTVVHVLMFRTWGNARGSPRGGESEEQRCGYSILFEVLLASDLPTDVFHMYKNAEGSTQPEGGYIN